MQSKPKTNTQIKEIPFKKTLSYFYQNRTWLEDVNRSIMNAMRKKLFFSMIYVCSSSILLF